MNTRAPREDDGFRAAPKEPLLQRAVPVSGDLPDYGTRKARGDLIAALTVAALAVPSAMAYAELAGLSPVAGLYALLLPTVAYALFGSSRRLVVGPEGSISALVGANGVTLRIARMKTHVRDELEEAGIAERIGRDRFHPTVRAAVSASTASED